MTTLSIEVIREARRQLARESFNDFTRIVDIPGAPIDDDESMALPTSWDRPVAAHHELLIERLLKVEAGEIQRLMVFMPPGSAKSTYASVLFPAWFMGRKRGRQVLTASYNSELATSMGENTRAVVAQPIYEELFGASLSPSTSAKDNWRLNGRVAGQTKPWGGYYAGGLMSGITGRRADLVVVDDPIKGQNDADSQAVRDKVYAEWEASVKTRARPGCRFVIIQTRWHEDDLAGRILPEGYKGQSGDILCRDGQVWHVINLPAEAYLSDDPLGRADGEMLWPEYFSAEHWSQYRGNQRVWNALYQQRPTGDEGTEFKSEWFQGGLVDGIEYAPTMYAEGQQPKHLNVYMTSDHARKESSRSDFNVFRVWGVDADGHLWLLDSVRRKGDLLDAMGVSTVTGKPMIADGPNRGALALIRKWKPKKWFPESDPSWQMGERLIRSYLRDFGLWTQIDAQSTRVKGAVGKVEKARPYIELCSQSKVHLPQISTGYDTIAEYVSFPAGAHDDQVDADAMMGRVMGEYHRALIPAAAKEVKKDRYKAVVASDRHSQAGLF